MNSSPTQKTEQAHHPAKTILIVDDYEDNLRMMRMLLEMSGYRVLAAANGLDAVRLTLQEKPSVIIMDVGLPLLDGMEATRRIRQIPEISRTRIIVLSAYDAATARDEAIAAGCDNFLTKPVDYTRLEELIRGWLEGGNE